MKDRATTEVDTLALRDALPIYITDEDGRGDGEGDPEELACQSPLGLATSGQIGVAKGKACCWIERLWLVHGPVDCLKCSACMCLQGSVSACVCVCERSSSPPVFLLPPLDPFEPTPCLFSPPPALSLLALIAFTRSFSLLFLSSSSLPSPPSPHPYYHS